jgi:RNA polymerase sigma factor (sigma-70 family)
MGTSERSSTSDAAGFAVTRWSMVVAAGHSGAAARGAMEELARAYWYPLYAYIRRQGHDGAEAEDLTQEFFARVIEKKALSAADRTKGKFRAFLLTSARHFLANARDHARAQKRGGDGEGGQRVFSLEALDAEARYAVEPADGMTPERVFEQRWAQAVLEQTLARLREKYRARDQSKLFEVLKGTLTAPANAAVYAELAGRLGITPGAAAVAVHRIRRHYRQALRDEISQTVASPELIEEEIDYLLHCL